jgi:hypothetical protein
MLLEDQVVPEAKSVSPCIKEPEYEERCRARFWRLKMVKLYGGVMVCFKTQKAEK